MRALSICLLPLLATTAAAAPIFTVNAGYQGDNTAMSVTNTGDVTLTNLTIAATAGPFVGQTEAIIASLAPGATANVPFNNVGGAFSKDYDDFNGSGVSNESTYVITSNQVASYPFSPSVNSTGGFVDFLGTGPDNNFSPVQVSSSLPTPEPATLAVFGGIALAGALGYRRRKANAVV